MTVSSGGIVAAGLTLSGGTASISGSVAAGQTMAFAGTGGDLALYNLPGFSAVIGGFGSLPGALLGGIALGVVNALVGRYVSSSYQTFIAFGILLTLLALRPQGLMGRDWEES